MTIAKRFWKWFWIDSWNVEKIIFTKDKSSWVVSYFTAFVQYVLVVLAAVIAIKYFTKPIQDEKTTIAIAMGIFLLLFLSMTMCAASLSISCRAAYKYILNNCIKKE